MVDVADGPFAEKGFEDDVEFAVFDALGVGADGGDGVVWAGDVFDAEDAGGELFAALVVAAGLDEGEDDVVFAG